jgi:hypothetical protein
MAEDEPRCYGGREFNPGVQVARPSTRLRNCMGSRVGRSVTGQINSLNPIRRPLPR